MRSVQFKNPNILTQKRGEREAGVSPRLTFCAVSTCPLLSVVVRCCPLQTI